MRSFYRFKALQACLKGFNGFPFRCGHSAPNSMSTFCAQIVLETLLVGAFDKFRVCVVAQVGSGIYGAALTGRKFS